MDALTASGQTNFMEGLNIAFNIFDQSAVSTGCAGQKVILFMTDGNTDVSIHFCGPGVQNPGINVSFISRQQSSACDGPH